MTVTVPWATLTTKQRDILQFLLDFQAQHGYSPCIREVGKQFGIKSPNGVMCHIRALVQKGYLSKSSRTARSFVVVKTPDGRVIGEPTTDPRLAAWTQLGHDLLEIVWQPDLRERIQAALTGLAETAVAETTTVAESG